VAAQWDVGGANALAIRVNSWIVAAADGPALPRSAPKPVVATGCAVAPANAALQRSMIKSFRRKLRLHAIPLISIRLRASRAARIAFRQE
jgi:hypothetical protein